MDAPRPTRPLDFGDHRFDPVLNELIGPAGSQRLPLKQADLLLRLLREPGLPVKRETLLDEVWERRFVNEEVLSRAIADLRQALGDDARAPRYIETLPKVGYRWVAPVREVESAAHRVPPPLRAEPAWMGMAFALAAALVLAPFVAWPTTSSGQLTPERMLHARPFTAERGRELFPRFTPDARWVVYTRFTPGEGAAHLRLRAVDGTDDRVLVQDAHENYCGAISPDGGTLAWLRLRDGQCEVMQRALLGGSARAVASCGTGNALGCPDFTHDGRALVFESGAADRGLRLIAVDGGAPRTLSTPPAGSSDLAPRVTRDGRAVVFWRGDGNTRMPMRVALAGGHAAVLDDHGYLAFGHAFDRDGVLVSADDRFGQRALVRNAGAAAQLLGGHGARFPDIAADGALVYEAAQYDANLWRIDLEHPDAPPRQLTRTARYDSQPALSPDGEWLAFGSNRDGREGVYLMRSDGREERKLPLEPAQRWTSPAWSPDGTQLWVLRYTEAGSTVCRHTIASARTECPPGLAPGRNGVFALGPDEFGAVDESAEAGLWSHRFEGAASQRVDTGGPVDRCRADERWLACHRPGQPGLWLQDRRTGAQRTILPELAADLRAWDLVDGALWFPRAGHEPGLFRHDLATGETRRVHALVPSAIGDALSLGPGGRFAILARTDALDVDLMYLPPGN